MKTETKFNFAETDNLNITKENAYTNKYGETIDMIETKDGDVYFKYEDFHNQFIKFDDLLKLNHLKLVVILNSEEKKFVCGFLSGTKYEYLIPHIMEQKPF
jgi:hypothetical protein